MRVEDDRSSGAAANTGGHRVDQGAGGARDQREAERRLSLRFAGQVVIWGFLALFVLTVLLMLVGFLGWAFR